MLFSFVYDSQFFFDLSEVAREGLLSRKTLFLKWVQAFFLLPFACFYKAIRTFFRALRLGVVSLSFLFCLGVLDGQKARLEKKAKILGLDLADWFLLPFACFSCTMRLILPRIR